MVDISPAAAAEIKRILSNRHNGSLRLIVRSGGCSGLYYDLKFDEVNAANKAVSSSDLPDKDSVSDIRHDRYAVEASVEDTLTKEARSTQNIPANEGGEERYDRYNALSLSHSNLERERSTSGDRLLAIDDINLRVDMQSWKYVEHLKLDYSQDLMGGGFASTTLKLKMFVVAEYLLPKLNKRCVAKQN